MRVTYYVEIMSSWCHWAEPAWNALKRRFAAEDVVFEWSIALMDPAAFPDTPAECDWYYQRSGTIARSAYMLNSAWLQPERKGDYVAPNLVAEAGRDFGIDDDSLRRALARAAMIDGRTIGDMIEAVAVGAEVSGIDATRLRAAAESPAVRKRANESTAIFRAHQLNQRPAFILENGIGDKSVFCGLWVEAPLVAAIEAMLADDRGYETHRMHYGDLPA